MNRITTAALSKRWRGYAIAASLAALLAGAAIVTFTPLLAIAQSALNLTFSTSATIQETSTASLSSDPYLWVDRGAKLIMVNGLAQTIQGSLPTTDPWRATYAKAAPSATDNGAHPQNLFLSFTKTSWQNVTARIYVNRIVDNLSNAANRHAYNGESIIARYKDTNNYYYAGIRADGGVVIKKKYNGVYTTLASKKLFPGTYNETSNPNLIPLNTWIGMKFDVTNNSAGAPVLTFYTDVGKTGTWTKQLSVVDDKTPGIASAGTVGIQSDYADVKFDNFVVEDPAGSTAPAPSPTPSPSTGYDSVVLGDGPVMYLALSNAGGTETDKTGNGHNGTYKGGTPSIASMPNGDKATVFNGSSNYVSVPSHAALSIPTTKKLTWEGWIRPDTLNFANASGDEYVDWMGKCEDYSPTCEWEARIYSQNTPERRPNRFSAYAFNPGAGLGSGADWQPSSGQIAAGQWYHVVAQYDLTTTPSVCSSSRPGMITIWVNGVKWSMADHMDTGCMSQYDVTPKAGSSPLNIGTMAMDTWFKGAIGKVAVYNRLLTQAEITEHYTAMTGKSPTGSCGDTCHF